MLQFFTLRSAQTFPLPIVNLILPNPVTNKFAEGKK